MINLKRPAAMQAFFIIFNLYANLNSLEDWNADE